MIRTIVRHKISVAHKLRPPYPRDGKCARMHGHNYHIEAWFEADEPDERGFVGVDFADFKGELNRRFDHRILNDCPPFDIKQPSVENLVGEIGRSFRGRGCVRVSARETDDGEAVWVVE